MVAHALGDHAAAQAGELERFWQPRAMQISALMETGIDTLWQAVTEYQTLGNANGKTAARRKQQSHAWMWERIDAGLKDAFRAHPQVAAQLDETTAQVLAGQVPRVCGGAQFDCGF